MCIRLSILLALLLAALALWPPSAPSRIGAASHPTATPTLDMLHPVTPRPWPPTPTPDVSTGAPITAAPRVVLPIVRR